MDRGARWASVHGVTKSRKGLSSWASVHGVAKSRKGLTFSLSLSYFGDCE